MELKRAAWRRPATWFSAVGLRAWLVLLLLLFGIPLLAERGQDILQTRRERIEAARRHVLSATGQGAATLADMVAEVRAVLAMAAVLPQTAADSGRACHEPFRRLAEGSPWLKNIWLVRPDGVGFCSNLPENVTLAIADRPYFRKVMAADAFVLSDPLISRIDGRPTLIAALPRPDPAGRTAVVLAAAIDLDWLGRLAAPAAGGWQPSVLVVDRAGLVLAAYPQPQLWRGRRLAAITAPAAPVVEVATAPVRGPDGGALLFGYAPLGETGATLAVGFDRAEVLAPIDRLARAAFLKLALTGLFLIGIVWFGVERLVLRPLKALTASATRLGGGDFAARAPLAGLVPEFRHLAATFNAMAARLADQAAEMRSTNEQLAELAATDSLTGIANRRHFDRRLDEEWRRGSREGRPLALLMLDIDGFKRFNDRYGHLAGDECLRQVVSVIAAHARRPGDLAARLGGEEFALLLPGAALEAALVIAERIRCEVADLTIPHQDGIDGRVTVSIGVAAMQPGPGHDAEALRHGADNALYAAKAAGRNRVSEAGAWLSLVS